AAPGDPRLPGVEPRGDRRRIAAPPRGASEYVRSHRELSARGHLLVHAEDLLGDAVALDDAGRTGAVVGPPRLPECAHALGVGEAWRGGHQGELDVRHVRLLDEAPRWLAAGVLLDRHALPRRHGLAGDPREPQ